MHGRHTLLKKVEELSARVVALERRTGCCAKSSTSMSAIAAGSAMKVWTKDASQLELLLQGLPNVIALPTPEPNPAAASRSGTPHPVRRMLAEDKLETREIVIEPVGAGTARWVEKGMRTDSQFDWVAPKIIAVFISGRVM